MLLRPLISMAAGRRQPGASITDHLPELSVLRSSSCQETDTDFFTRRSPSPDANARITLYHHTVADKTGAAEPVTSMETVTAKQRRWSSIIS